MFIKWAFYIFVLIILLVNLFIILSGRYYLYKGVAHTYLKGRTGPSIYDRDIFPYRTLQRSDNSFQWMEALNIPLGAEEKAFMQQMESSSFLVFKGDRLIHESYWNGHDQETVSNSFSAAKTVVALLIGVALQEGKIKSIDEPVSNYLERFKRGDRKKVSIRHLLMMASGLNWQESGANPLSENAESYYGSNLYSLSTRQKLINEPGKHFNYQSGNSQLLGFIVEEATGMNVSEYAQKNIWGKIGTEHDAFWSLDREDGHEKSFCCLYSTSRDFGRLGRLIKNRGNWNGEQLISKDFMDDMFTNPTLSTDEHIPNYRYGLHIWTYLGGDSPVYYCRGILGQYIIAIPEKDLVIVRTGMKRKDNIEKNTNMHKIGHPADLFTYIESAEKILAKSN